jgi:NADH-quinone oxidoreductase subunit E
MVLSSKEMEKVQNEAGEVSRKEVVKLIKKDSKKKLLLDKLHAIQEKFDYIPEEEIVKLAEERDMPKAHLYGIISFYSRFYTKAVGKYKVRVCKSISCGMNGSKKILKVISEALGIESGETTEDRLFTLEAVECLGHCGEGPVITVNDEVYGEVTEAKALEIIEEYRESGEQGERRKIS